MTPLRSVRLFFQEGSSDKVYHATILEDGGAYTVRVEWGRRGAKLNQGNKAVRVTLAAAEKTVEKLVREKRGKGYEEISEAVQPAAVAPPEGKGSGSKVGGKRAKVGDAAQLLNPIEDDEIDAFLRDEAMLGQQKIDGQRVLARVERRAVVATNRAGQPTSVAAHLLAGLEQLPAGSVVDGEVVPHEDGPVYWLFDVLQVGTEDLRPRGYHERWSLLEGELEPGLGEGVRVLPTAVGAKAKRALHERLRAARAEGMVFKHRDAPYKAGRPASGGTQRKLKFVKTADVVILENAGNAYLMAVRDGSRLFEVGRVFAGTTNESRKELDAILSRGMRPVAEVRYLYATDDHQLYQPVFVGLRGDKSADECVREQLVRTCRDVL